MNCKATYFPIVYNEIFLVIVCGKKWENYVDRKHAIYGLVHYEHVKIVKVRESEEERSQCAGVDE